MSKGRKIKTVLCYTRFLYVALPTHRVFVDAGSDGSPDPADVNARA